jgi:hypothetical protein
LTTPLLTISSNTLPIYNTTDSLINKSYVDNNFLNLSSSSQTIGGEKTFNNIKVTGTINETGNMIIGDSITDLLTINSTTKVNNVNLTPTQLSKIQYLDISTALQATLDNKPNLDSQNYFTGINVFNSNVEIQDLIVKDGPGNGSIQFIKSTDGTIITEFRSNQTTEELNITSKANKNINFISGSTVVGTINGSLDLINSTDLITKEKYDLLKREHRASFLTNYKTMTGLNQTFPVASSSCYINFTNLKPVRNVVFEVTYGITTSNNNTTSLLGPIFGTAIYSAHHNGSTCQLTQISTSCVSIANLQNTYSLFGQSYTPFKCFFSNNRVQLTFGFPNLPLNKSNLVSGVNYTQYISSYGYSVRLIGSESNLIGETIGPAYTTPYCILDSNAVNWLRNSFVGNAYLTVT